MNYTIFFNTNFWLYRRVAEPKHSERNDNAATPARTD